MTHSFDQITDRRGTSSTKWQKYGDSPVLPMWVADTDFQAPAFILDAIRARLDHGIIGYTDTPQTLVDAFTRYAVERLNWAIDPDWLVWLPGVVPGLNLAARACQRHLIIPTPIYYPFLNVAGFTGLAEHRVPSVLDGGRWVMDLDAIRQLPPGGLILLASPQNPTGRVFDSTELDALAQVCRERDHWICSDDIHCELLLDPGTRHVPIATIDPEIAAHSVTLFAVTKTYNIPGLSCAVAVIPDPSLRRRFRAERVDLTQGPGPLAFAASEAGWLGHLADSPNVGWLTELRSYLASNHAALQACVGQLPSVSMTPVEGTYLGWLDVSELGLANPQAHFETHGLGLSPGPQFAGDGFLRLNFGCPRETLDAGLARLRAGVDAATS